MSNDYFTNRQDRYIMIEDCKDLCNFYDEIVKKVGEFSFKLQSDGTTTYDSDMSHPLNSSKKKFTWGASQSIRSLFEDEMNKRVEANKSGNLISPNIKASND